MATVDRSRRASFRRWRRTRPFWGGLLLIIAGIELLLIPLGGVLLKGQIKLVIYIGIGGVFGVLIGVLLILCGLMLWFNPLHKTFYAVLGVLLSLLSFIVTNLGGFFIGMLLGIVGGAMAFGWSPLPATGGGDGGVSAPESTPDESPGQSPGGPADRAQDQPTEARNEGMNLILGAPSDAPTTPPDAARTSATGRSAAGTTSDSLLDTPAYGIPRAGPGQDDAATSGGQDAAATGAVSGSDTTDERDGDEHSREPRGAHRRTSRGPRGGRGWRRGGTLALVGLSTAVAGSLLTAGRQQAADAAVSRAQRSGQGCILLIFCSPSSPSPSPSPPAGRSSSGTPAPTPSTSSPTGGLLPSPGGSSSPSARPSAGAGKATKNKKSPNASALPGLEAATVPVVEKAGSVTLHGFAYQGVANVPVAGGGTVQMMKFTASSITLTGGITVTATQNGRTLTTTNTSLDLTGGVVLYATKLSGNLQLPGNLAGVPLTLTPGNVESVLLQLLNSVTPAIPVTMTNVTTDQPLVTTNSLQANGLVVTAS